MQKWVVQFYDVSDTLVAEESISADDYDGACGIADSMSEDFGAAYYEIA